jgi:hypothetical protein
VAYRHPLLGCGHEISNYSGFWLIGPPVNWGKHLFGVNPEEQKQIENITRIFFMYLGHHAV